jgi:hypothetical protein
MFEKTIKQIINDPRLKPSEGHNLLGMSYDISHAFESIDIFNVLEINQTGSKECMFDIRLTVSKSDDVCELVGLGLQEAPDDVWTLVGLGFQEAWHFIAYSDFQASSFTSDNNNAIFKFVTVAETTIDGDGDGDEYRFYVTGKVTISGLSHDFSLL